MSGVGNQNINPYLINTSGPANKMYGMDVKSYYSKYKSLCSQNGITPKSLTDWLHNSKYYDLEGDYGRQRNKTKTLRDESHIFSKDYEENEKRRQWKEIQKQRDKKYHIHH
jgi:hypothetical protein